MTQAPRLTTLGNGLRIVSQAMDHVKTASLQITVGVGGRDESDNEHGISHLLEHMAFKGTGKRTARQIAEEVEALGGDLNAATSSEQTSYYVKLLGEDAGAGLDILADILTDPTFAPEELAKEQNVIIQEIGAAEDTPDDVIYDHFSATAFPGQTLGRSILGTPETVRSFTPDAVRSYLTRHYTTERIVVSACGAIDHDWLVEEAARLLEPLAGAAPALPRKADYKGGSVTTPRDLEQSHVVIGFPGVSFKDPTIYALGVFSSLLGGGLSSRLFQEIREERGLCYSIYAFHWPFSDTGLFGIGAGTDPKDLPALVDLALQETRKAAETVSDAEIRRAKAQMKVGLLGALESSSARADQLARQVQAFGAPVALDDIAGRIERVSMDDVKAAARALYENRALTFAAIGPKKGLAEAARLAKAFG